MAGYSPNSIKAPSAANSKLSRSEDPCDLLIYVELVGIRSSAASHLHPGDRLEVTLISREAVMSVVCQTAHGEVVGALAAFRGLAQLIRCVNEGSRFVAYVTEASATRCAVKVERLK